MAIGCILPGSALGFGAGVSGYSGKPPAMSCNDCHHGGTPPVSVTLSGPQDLAPGERAVYTLDVMTAASNTVVGFDIATSAGALAVIAGQPNASYVDNGEITHTKDWPRGKTVQLMFTLTAPESNGPLTLYADALAADGADDEAGDAALAATLDVSVAAPDLFGRDLSGLTDLAPAVDAVSSATTVKATPALDLGPPRNEARWACDCQLAPHAPMPSGELVMLTLFTLLAWRRKQ